MKFTCPKCSTRYSIADEKVPSDKTLRFTCKKCENVIKLRRKAKSAPSVEAPAPVETRIASLNEISALASAAKKPAEQPSPAATRIASLNEIIGVKEASKKDGKLEPTSRTPPPLAPFAAADEWYVLVAGRQVGPLAAAHVGKMLKSHEVDKRTYAWRDGMADWTRLGSIDEFAELAAASGDAAWRVVKPKEEKPEGKKKGAAAPDPDTDPEVDAMDVIDSDEPIEDGSKRRPTVTMVAPRRGANVTDIAVAAALSGEPTGETMRRTDKAPARAATAELADFVPSGKGESPFFEKSDPNLGLAPDGTPKQVDPSYLQAPPGENTRIFMAASGIYKQQRTNRIAAMSGISFVLVLGIFAALDLSGLVSIPGMGAVYDMTGMVDPNADRARERTEQKLASSDLSEEERKALRDKLLGLGGKPKVAAGAKPEDNAPQPTVGVQDQKTLSQDQRALVGDIFASKEEKTISLAAPGEIQTPNLPEGLTQEAIFKVISDSTRSMSLCYAQSMKAGEQINGKMEVELTINAEGAVADAKVESPKFRTTTFAACTVKTVKRWKFPRFNGEPITVVFPYVLSAGI